MVHDDSSYFLAISRVQHLAWCKVSCWGHLNSFIFKRVGYNRSFLLAKMQTFSDLMRRCVEIICPWYAPLSWSSQKHPIFICQVFSSNSYCDGAHRRFGADWTDSNPQAFLCAPSKTRARSSSNGHFYRGGSSCHLSHWYDPLLSCTRSPWGVCPGALRQRSCVLGGSSSFCSLKAFSIRHISGPPSLRRSEKPSNLDPTNFSWSGLCFAFDLKQ